VRFVTAHGIGIRTNPDGTPVNTVLIPRNSPVPAAAHQRFRTKKTHSGPATGIRVVVTQGDTPDAGLAEVVGTARITGIPPDDPPGQPVEITLAFDPQSRVRLRALYVNTGRELALDLDVPGGLREEEVKHYHDLLVSSGIVNLPEDDVWPALPDDLLSLDDEDDGSLLEPID
jgi:molecular chaperone DnaK (HSP70)